MGKGDGLRMIQIQKKIDMFVLIFFASLYFPSLYVGLKILRLLPREVWQEVWRGESRELFLFGSFLGVVLLVVSSMIAVLISYQIYISHTILEGLTKLTEETGSKDVQ